MKKISVLLLVLTIFAVAVFYVTRPQTPEGTLPEYEGKAYTAVNGNTPEFPQKELSAEAYESYSPLDFLDRSGVAEAVLGKETMPHAKEERGDISGVYPSGWVQAKYDGWLYNRCHLIGWQLSAENDNERNLITGTNYMNVEGMLPFENMVADYIKETGNHVAYRVTPIFEGDNLVCSGVQMEAYSIEDMGEGICFNVFCHNVQPGVIIDYKTGESRADESFKKVDGKYIINEGNKKFHLASCNSANSISDKNKRIFKGERDSLIDEGYIPAGCCKP